MTIAPELIAQLKRDENAQHLPGRRFYPFRDTAGHLTLGWGRNLDADGISEAEAEVLLEHDIDGTEAALRNFLPWTARLDPARFGALVNMAFNVGVAGLLTSNPKMLQALQDGDFVAASREMLGGPYEAQVGDRARRLAHQVATGTWS